MTHALCECFSEHIIIDWNDCCGLSICRVSTAKQYWGLRATTRTILSGYPKPLTSLGLPSSVNKVDAALYVKSTGKTLFFVNRKYWRWVTKSGQMWTCLFLDNCSALQLWRENEPNGLWIPTLYSLGFPWNWLQSGRSIWELRWDLGFVCLR